MKRLLIITAIILLAIPCRAEVILTTSTEYYPVDGIGKNEILKNLKKEAPQKKGKEYFPAYTQTGIKYEYSWGKRKGRCDVTKATVYLNLTYVYPRLARTQDKRTRTWWEETLKKYEIHEKIHGKISRRSANELDKKLNSLKNLDCNRAKETISARAKYIIRQMRKRQEEYDRVTKHGRKQEKYRDY